MLYQEKIFGLSLYDITKNLNDLLMLLVMENLASNLHQFLRVNICFLFKEVCHQYNLRSDTARPHAVPSPNSKRVFFIGFYCYCSSKIKI